MNTIAYVFSKKAPLFDGLTSLRKTDRSTKRSSI